MFNITPNMLQGLKQALGMAQPNPQSVGTANMLQNGGQALQNSGATNMNFTNSAQGLNIPTVDASGRVQQNVPQAVNPYTDMALQGAQAPGLAPQLAAAKEANIQQLQNPTGSAVPQQQQGAPSPGSMPQGYTSDLGGAIQNSISTIQDTANNIGTASDKSWFQTIVNNLSGKGLDSPEALAKWQQMQTLGVIGNRLGSAIAGKDTAVGNAAGMLGDMFAGNLAAKNAEQNIGSQNDYMQKALNAITGKPTTPAQGAQTPNMAQGGSSLSGQSFVNPTMIGQNSFDDISNRMRRLGNIGG